MAVPRKSETLSGQSLIESAPITARLKPCADEKQGLPHAFQARATEPVLLEEGGGHEAEDENQEGKEGGAVARVAQWFRMEDGKRAKKTDADEQSGPDIPAAPVAESQESQEHGKKNRGGTMSALADGAEDVAAIELPGGKKIERSGEKADPCGASDRMKKEVRGVSAMMKNRREEMEDERRTEDNSGVRGVGKARNKLGVDDAVD